jgi:phage N-6-adenine-methyltransferase
MSKTFHNATKLGPENTISDVWLTPKWIIDTIGPFDLDPCGHLPEGKPIIETANKYFTENENGLSQDWSPYKVVFVNPPYSDLRNWLNKCKEESFKGVQIIVLCFVRSETKAWQDNVKHSSGINLINKRIKFLDANGIERGNGNAPSALIAFGEEAFNRIKRIDGLIFKTNE